MSCTTFSRGVISRSFFSRLFFGKAVAVNHVVNGSQADLEPFGRAATVAMACFEGVDEACFSEGLDAAGAALEIFRFGWFFDIEIVEVSEIAGADEAVIGVGDGVFEHAVKLADVSRPRVIAEQLHRLASDTRHP